MELLILKPPFFSISSQQGGKFNLLVFGNFSMIIKKIIFNRAFSLGIHEIMDIYLPTVDIF